MPPNLLFLLHVQYFLFPTIDALRFGYSQLFSLSSIYCAVLACYLAYI